MYKKGLDIQPGEIYFWSSGSYCMSWPPDGHRNLYEPIRVFWPEQNALLLIIAKTDYHGAIVLCDNNVWWCPIMSIS